MSRKSNKYADWLRETMWRCSPRGYFGLRYFKYRGRFPSFKNPRDMSELILSQILSGEIVEYAPFVDKLTVRDFITEWGFGQYLPLLYGVWSSPEEIDFDTLPNSFALKTNHGCGSHYICFGKSSLNKDLAVAKINDALQGRYSFSEKQYSCITPRCYAEEYINDLRGGGAPLDYKFMCFEGEPCCIFTCSERDTGTKLKAYDIEWNELNWIRKKDLSNQTFEKPAALKEMLQITRTIASQFKQVRVDLYFLPDEGRVLIGELTFTDSGGFLYGLKNKAIRLPRER